MNELSIIKRKNLKTKSWKTIKDDVYGKQGTRESQVSPTQNHFRKTCDSNVKN